MIPDVAIITPSLHGVRDSWRAMVHAAFVGLRYSLHTVVGKPLVEKEDGRAVGGARYETTLAAMGSGAPKMLFLDDDVWPHDGVLEALATNPLIAVSAVYTVKRNSETPCFAPKRRDDMIIFGPGGWRWPGIIEADAFGLGCACFDRTVLSAIPAEEWFDWNWRRPLERGGFASQSKGEDIHLCWQARKRGTPLHVDTSLHADHHDHANGRVYPSKTYWTIHHAV